MQDDGLPTEDVLDDQAELLIGNRNFPAVEFRIGTALAFHPGDAAGVLTEVGKATSVRLRSDGAGTDSGAIAIKLPPEALNWLKQCGKTFDIAIDKPTDPNAPDLPTPRPRSPKISIMPATPAGPPGIEDKQKIDGWDASELRNTDGSVFICMIRRRYAMGSEASARRLTTFAMVSRRKGLTLLLKDSSLNLPEGKPIEATLEIGDAPFTAFSAEVQGPDEIGIFPQHAAALAAMLEKGLRATFKADATDKLEFPVSASVVPWLRACARRNGIPLEPAGG
jgi:hypothetical protein